MEEQQSEMGRLAWRGAARDASHAECNEESDLRGEMCSPWSASTTREHYSSI